MSLDVKELEKFVESKREKLGNEKRKKEELEAKLSLAELRYNSSKTDDNRQMIKGIKVECEESRRIIDKLERDIKEKIEELKLQPGFKDYIDEKLKEGYQKSYNRFIEKNRRLSDIKQLSFDTDKDGNKVITDFGNKFMILLECRVNIQQYKAEIRENENALKELENKDNITDEEKAKKEELIKKNFEIGLKIGKCKKKFDSAVTEMASTTSFTKNELANMINLFEGQNEKSRFMYINRGKNGEIDLAKTIEKKMKWNSNQALNNLIAYKSILDRQAQHSAEQQVQSSQSQQAQTRTTQQQPEQAQPEQPSQPEQEPISNNHTVPIPVTEEVAENRGIFSRIGNWFSNIFNRIKGRKSEQAQPSQSEPAQQQSEQAQPSQSEPAQQQSEQAQPSQSEPAQQQPEQEQPSQSEPAQQQPEQEQSSQTEQQEQLTPEESRDTRDEWLESLKYSSIATDEYKKQRDEIFEKANKLRRQASNQSQTNSGKKKKNEDRDR